MIPDGIHLNTRRDQYDLIERVNFSTLKHIKKSPKRYRYELTNPAPDTDPKKVGRCVHLATFEPEKFRTRVAKWDGGTRRGKEWEAFKAKNEGRELLTENEYEECTAIQAAVRADKWAAPYLSNGRGEVTLAWTHTAPAFGGRAAYEIACKGRIDFDVTAAITDLKTTRDISQEAFGRQVWGLNYHAQAAWYVDGYERATGIRKPFVFVAVEHTPPYEVVVYRVPDRHLELGREEYREWLDRLAWCRETSTWPGYADSELELELPRWAEPDDDIGGLGLVIGGT